jgi:hypothetical protein
MHSHNCCFGDGKGLLWFREWVLRADKWVICDSCRFSLQWEARPSISSPRSKYHVTLFVILKLYNRARSHIIFLTLRHAVGLARALEMERQRARCIRGLYRHHNSWYSRTVTKQVVDELVTRKGCGVVAMTFK